MRTYEEVTEQLNHFRFKKDDIGRIEVEIESYYRKHYLSESDLISDISELEKEHQEKKIKLELESEFPNLVITARGVWLNQAGGPPIAAGIPSFEISRPDRGLLFDLNKAAEKLKDPELFFCTSCMDVKRRRDDLEGSVFAGYFCRKCASSPSKRGLEIAKLIKDSKNANFYD